MESEEQITAADILDVLMIAGAKAKSDPDTWTDGQKACVFDWATSVHIAASDNNIDVPPMPETLVEYVKF